MIEDIYLLFLARREYIRKFLYIIYYVLFSGDINGLFLCKFVIADFYLVFSENFRSFSMAPSNSWTSSRSFNLGGSPGLVFPH